MRTKIKIEFMIYPLPPYRIRDVLNEINGFVNTIALDSGLDSEDLKEKIEIQSERFLLTKDDIETVKIILEIINIVGPQLKKLIIKIYESIRKKFGTVKVIRVTVGDKIIEVPYTKNENIEVILTELDK